MANKIKSIEGQSVHRIQSGQVIVDLCSVAKELVENSLDAGATSIEIRFKDNGLESIEVQDNGEGIPPESYESVALKHYTSKLSTYADLESLQTFGFRGEALSSLCAVSELHIITSRADEAPKGKKLEFHHSGKLRGTQVVAAQRGTTVVVQNLFKGLPVRRRELEKNIKREYGKVLGILQAYACISTGVRFVVSNQMPNGRKATAFATRSNQTTRENIMNVFGAKTLAGLMPLDLNPELQSSTRGSMIRGSDVGEGTKHVRILGLITRPSLGEGRQTPDRQMFFVNKRPCGLPQVAKAFNEAYRTFNMTQSPFIVADLRMDTSAYDVNVSPDKRTILLHDQSALLEAVKTSIHELFEKQDQIMPQTQMSTQKLPAFKQLSISRSSTSAFDSTTGSKGARADDQIVDTEVELDDSAPTNDSSSSLVQEEAVQVANLLQDFISGKAVDRNARREARLRRPSLGGRSAPVESSLSDRDDSNESMQVESQEASLNVDKPSIEKPQEANSEQGFIESQELPQAVQLGQANNASTLLLHSEHIAATSVQPSQQTPGIVQRTYDRSRPNRPAPDTATITIGSKTITSPMKAPAAKRPRLGWSQREKSTDSSQMFAQSLRAFAATGSQIEELKSQAIEISSTSTSDELEVLSQQSSPHLDAQEPKESVEDDKNARDSRAPVMEEDLDDVLMGAPSRYSNGEYFDEAKKKAQEEARVEQLIHDAEEQSTHLDEHNANRFKTLKPSGSGTDSTRRLTQQLHTSAERIEQQWMKFNTQLQQYAAGKATQDTSDADVEDLSAEEHLSLTVSKDDFRRMKVVGQFNLGFILAVRHPHANPEGTMNSTRRNNNNNNNDELFIIDQHASDEIYNFERLQAQTVVQNQPLVTPRTLDLTAIEEEIILENLPVLEKNGFKVEIDDSGGEPVGRRCKLVSLPMSREVVFDTRDLEELLALLAEAPPGSAAAAAGSGSSVIRPSKVRRMFAMRACRSSIMIGRTLNLRQMAEVVRHMGEMDKPWNCPHGRPTMRHLMTLDTWDGWREGCGLADQADEEDRLDEL